MLKMDGFDSAIIGEVIRFNQTFLIYDQAKVIKILTDMGMSNDEAYEYWSFNQLGAWVGEGTPAFLVERYENGTEN